MSEKIPKGWKWVKLGEVAEIVKDIVNPNEFDDLNYIGLEHIGQENLRIISIGKSREVNSAKYLFKPNDILFGKLRPYFRKVVKPKFNGICSTDIWVFRAKQGYDQNYLYYFLANWDFVNLASSGEGGTRMPRADWNYLKQTEWIFPPLPEQKAIAEVLSSIDDKIDLLHRQNKTLEEMAMTLFRQWFIEPTKDGLPEGWEEVRLGEFFPVITGKKDANFATDDGSYPFFTCSQKPLKAPNYSFDGNAILLAGNGDFNIKRYKGKFEAYQRTYVLIPYNSEYLNFLYLLMKFNLDEITGSFKGSVINYITKDMITDFKFSLPKDRSSIKDKLLYFDRIYDKVDVNTSQIQTLEKLRDTLLPKLMSGEVRVKMDIM